MTATPDTTAERARELLAEIFRIYRFSFCPNVDAECAARATDALRGGLGGAVQRERSRCISLICHWALHDEARCAPVLDRIRSGAQP